MGLFDFEQYPDYAMMDTPDGRKKKKWVSGPSPLSMALLRGGLGILAQPDNTSEWVGGGGGFDPSYIARGGLLGLEEFQRGHQDLRDQRSDFFTHRDAMENQLIRNQEAKRQHEEHLRLKQNRMNRDKSFPELLKTLTDSNRPEVQKAVPQLQMLYATSPEKGVAAAMNIVSQLKKPKPGEITYVEMKNDAGESLGSSYIMQDGRWLGTVKHSDSGSGSPETLDKKTYDALLLNASKADDTTSADDYNQLYTGRQRLNISLKDFKDDRGKITSRRYSGKLIGTQTPWDKFLNHPNPALRLTKDQMLAKGWSKDPTLFEEIGTSQTPISVTAQQSAYKISQIVSAQEEMDQLSAKGYDPTTKDAKSYAAFYAGKLDVNPFLGDEREFENAAVSGSMAFAYLFSGATVRAEEMSQFRKTMYPMPGDSKGLVAKKRKRRQRVIDLYNSMNPSSIKMAYALVKKANGNKLPKLDMKHVKNPNAGPNLSGKELVESLDWED